MTAPFPAAGARALRRVDGAIEPLDAELDARATRRALEAAALARAGAPPKTLTPACVALEHAATEALAGLYKVRDGLDSGDRLRDVRLAAGDAAEEVFERLGNARSLKSTAAIERLPELARPLEAPRSESETASSCARVVAMGRGSAHVHGHSEKSGRTPCKFQEMTPTKGNAGGIRRKASRR